MRGIALFVGVSWRWLQNYVNNKLAQVSRKIKVLDKPRGKITIECDELRSFVNSKGNEYWVWLAIDRKTREIVGCYLGNRSRESAKKLGKSLPSVYRQCVVAYTDFWEVYKTVIPDSRHRPVLKSSGETNHIERLNNTFRQRIFRLVRILIKESIFQSELSKMKLDEKEQIMTLTTSWEEKGIVDKLILSFVNLIVS